MATFASKAGNMFALRQSYNIKDTMGYNAQNQMEMILGTNSALLNQNGQFSPQYVEAMGTARKIDFTSSPYYKNYADMESVNAMIQNKLLNPQGEMFGELTQLLGAQSRAYAGNNRDYAQFTKNNRKRPYQQSSAAPPDSSEPPPVGMPVAQSWESLPYETATRQMIPQQQADYFSAQGGYATADQPIPNAWYLRDPVSGNLARQGGSSVGILTPPNKTASDLPEVQVSNTPLFPTPKRQVYPLYNTPYNTNQPFTN